MFSGFTLVSQGWNFDLLETKKELDALCTKEFQYGIHCLDNRLIDGSEVLSITYGPRSTLQTHFLVFLALISVRS
jgi:hypothetical protein